MMSIVTFLKGRHAVALVAVPVAAVVVAFFLWKTRLSVASGDVWDRPVTGLELTSLVGCATIMWCVSSGMGWVERASIRSLEIGYGSMGLWMLVRRCPSTAHGVDTAVASRRINTRW